MDRRDEHHVAPRRPRGRRGPALVVLLVLAVAAVSVPLDLGPRLLGWDWPSPEDQPALVQPPAGLDLAPVVAAAPVAEPLADVGTPDPDAIAAVLEPYVDDARLGGRLTVAVAALGETEPVVGLPPAGAAGRGGGRVLPASTTKLLTAAAALLALGPGRTFATTTRAVPGNRRVHLVGGGDPLLARTPAEGDALPYPPRADLETLARATAAALRRSGRSSVRVSWDSSLFVEEGTNPAWEASYVPDGVVAPVTALWVDQGRTASGAGRVADPAAAAADDLVAALRAEGITVRGEPVARPVPEEAVELASVSSAPVDQLVERVLEVSDNEAAEVLAHHVAVAEGEPATFAGAATAVRAVLARAGVDLGGDVLLDGSGLARGNRLSVSTLLGVLALAAREPALRPVLTGLPVAGGTGSLALRFSDDGDRAGQGLVRAKTGTLTGVHALAGVVVDAAGTPLAFVAVADRVRAPGGVGSGGVEQVLARDRVDDLAADLAACTCSTP